MGYLGGFLVTFRQRGRKQRVTREYAKDEGGKMDKAVRMHGRHVLNRYEDGMEKCIGCELCAGVCPAKCIYVRGADNDPAAPTSPGEEKGAEERRLENIFGTSGSNGPLGGLGV